MASHYGVGEMQQGEPRPRADRNSDRPLRIMPWWIALVAILLVLFSATGVLLWLLPIAGGNSTLKIEAIKVGLSVGAGVGGAFAILLAVRRQWLSERAQLHAEYVAQDTLHDAEQRRVTDLYAKSVEQLGSDKAAVRLGGLYALERLAQDHIEQRRTIVEVICAYLRMPFAAEKQVGERSDQGEESESNQSDREQGDVSQFRLPYVLDNNALQELQVRQAAQRVIARHLNKGSIRSVPDGMFWGDVDLDLNRATLVNFDLSECQIRNIDVAGAAFYGNTKFDDLKVTERAKFEACHFHGFMDMSGSEFSGQVRFGRVIFHGDVKGMKTKFGDMVHFDNAHFSGRIIFTEAVFQKHAHFAGCNFGGPARFTRAIFVETSGFREAHFDDIVRFSEVQFGGRPRFDDAVFLGDAGYGHSIFLAGVRFDNAKFLDQARFGGALFRRTARFDGATFSKNATFGGSSFEGRANFKQVTFVAGVRFDKGNTLQRFNFANACITNFEAHHEWPTGWGVVALPDARIGILVRQGESGEGSQQDPN